VLAQEESSVVPCINNLAGLKVLMGSDWLYLFRLSALLLLLAGTAGAQAGPPFRTDDPETPGNKHWEINFGFLGDRNPSEGCYSIPDFDINYGLGDRIQLKYELPIAVHDLRGGTGNTEEIAPASQAHVNMGLGQSLLGIKWRFYQHTPAPFAPYAEDADPPSTNFSISTYPQLSLNNPTSSVHRDVVPSGPQFLLPLEANARIGPIRIDGELGYWFTNRNVPQSWIRGIIVGHEFTKQTDAYLELYDQQDTNRVNGAAKQREATLGIGGRHAVDRNNTALLMLMGGRSFQKVVSGNGQPSWIAYIGIQLLLAPKESNTRVEKSRVPVWPMNNDVPR
jgi:hypothetical protein